MNYDIAQEEGAFHKAGRVFHVGLGICSATVVGPIDVGTVRVVGVGHLHQRYVDVPPQDVVDGAPQ